MTELQTAVDDLLGFLEQVVEAKLSSGERKKVKTFFSKARMGEEGDSTAIAVMTHAFTEDTLLRDSGKLVGEPLTWWEFLSLMLHGTTSWCDTKLKTYGNSPAVTEELVRIIQNIRNVTGVLHGQLLPFKEDRNLRFDRTSIPTNVKTLLIEMAHALRLASAIRR